jgi:hypothetical protein
MREVKQSLKREIEESVKPLNREVKVLFKLSPLREELKNVKE